VTRSTRALGWAYLLAAVLTAHCSVTSARNDAWWYAAGLFGVSLLLIVALAREYVAADERRAAAVRAERAARLRTWASQARPGLEDGCCERWWTSCGTEHDDLPNCTRKDQAA
jgi:predicted cobalt transporter CbtA